ncbi:MAG: deoxyribose-phosphate aldolase [Spirochaetia bacterium]|nr:deoxyribose-phosphate aldolase [Spirochaetia bacterium]MDD5776173.1 deoxyribose-phosphate aldolase [Treponema sp.]MCI5607965.1 deoxyribose-phosphate aldolase [Spirochaetia bacterium]MCI7110000.1 deoxyribose-phosphate aldolase [Spirochaetia bacterium]MCI7799910.1 deoxyribose-phosphate aldolase [Spirochaetia bacterium]
MTGKDIAKLIDHTLLSPQATQKEITNLCMEAQCFSFASVCVNPFYVKFCSELLNDSPVKVCTVIGFPLGANTTSVKIFEAQTAVKDGADEIDMVINVGKAIENDFDFILNEVKAVKDSLKILESEVSKKIILKVILETCFLSDFQIVECCKASVSGGADFVKTSTGFASPKSSEGQLLPNGASVHHVQLMRKTVGEKIGVKASGGIRSYNTLIQMVEAGATRIGTSSGVSIVQSL